VAGPGELVGGEQCWAGAGNARAGGEQVDDGRAMEARQVMQRGGLRLGLSSGGGRCLAGRSRRKALGERGNVVGSCSGAGRSEVDQDERWR
jgi:hypothetical protein